MQISCFYKGYNNYEMLSGLQKGFFYWLYWCLPRFMAWAILQVLYNLINTRLPTSSPSSSLHFYKPDQKCDWVQTLLKTPGLVLDAIEMWYLWVTLSAVLSLSWSFSLEIAADRWKPECFEQCQFGLDRKECFMHHLRHLSPV